MTDRVLNPNEMSIDVSIRIGPLRDSSLIATRIGSVRVVACASPELFRRAREAAHACRPRSDTICITIDESGVPRSWAFMQGEREIVASIRSRLTVSTSEAAVEAAVAGSGNTRVMSYKMQAARLSGALALVLEDFEKDPLPVHVLYAERKPMPLKLRVFLDRLTPRLKARLAPHTE